MSTYNYTNSTSLYPGASGAVSTDLLIAILAIAITVRVYRTAKGTRFSTAGLYMLPAFYLALTAISILELNPPAVDAIIAVVALLAGLLIGLRLAGGVHFFEKNAKVYYKRSPVIMILWLAAYVARFVVEISYPSVSYAGLAVGFLLACTTGLIMGEAFHIRRNYEAYRKKMGAPEQ